MITPMQKYLSNFRWNWIIIKFITNIFNQLHYFPSNPTYNSFPSINLSFVIFWSSTQPVSKIPLKPAIRIYFINLTFIFPKFQRCYTFNTIFIDTDIIIIWTIKLLINIFQLIEFFPWLFVTLFSNHRINVSNICTSKRTFFNRFNRRFICTNIHL